MFDSIFATNIITPFLWHKTSEMEEVTQYTEFREYVKDAKILIEQNPMLYHFLAETINQVVDGKVKVHKLFKIEKEDNLIMTLLTTEVCLIYDNNFNNNLTSLLSKELEFSKFIRYQFAGTKATIDALFEFNDAKYEMQKHRIIYKCSKVVDDFTPATGQMEMAEISWLDELITLSEGFATEYYDKDHELYDASIRVIAGIQANTLYQWVDNGSICSIAQSLHDEHDFPVIGHFYTASSARGKGYGTSIIHGLTKGLLGVGHDFVMLSAKAQTPASNRVFQKIGYIRAGEYLLAYKNKR